MTDESNSPRPDLPRVDVVIAVFDEAATIEGKITDLEALDYPTDRLRFLIADGASSDGTAERAADWAAADDRVVFVQTDFADKAVQLNAALDRCTADWVLVTDADARMPPETLRLMVGEALRSPEVAAVGTLADTPGSDLERVHWRLSNWIRRRESRTGTAGLVIATCYLFRRDLVDRFPPDCAADDVHVACRAATAGRRVGLAEVTVTETRTASSMRGLLRHKTRRARGYLREVLRFLPAMPRMPSPMRQVFAWRATALLAIPVALAALLLPVAAAAARGLIPLQVAVATTSVLALATGLVWARTKSGSSSRSIVVIYSAVTLAVLSLALLSYPFARKTARLERVEHS